MKERNHMYRRYKGFGETCIFKMFFHIIKIFQVLESPCLGEDTVNVIWYAEAAQSVCMNEVIDKTGAGMTKESGWTNENGQNSL